MEEVPNTPPWWAEVDELFKHEPRWALYKLLHRLDALERQVTLIGMLCTTILENQSEFDTQPVTATINMEDTDMADHSVRDTEGPLNATVSFADVHGHPTSPSDVPQWSTSDASVASVDASADSEGLSAVITVLGPGATVIGVSSAGPDGSTISAAGTLTVTSGEATTGEVTFTPAAEAETPPAETPPAETPPAA